MTPRDEPRPLSSGSDPSSSDGGSLWLREATDAMPSWPEAGAEELRCDVLVVGAGLAGCSAALALSARGLDTLVLERDGPGRGASGRNAGFVLLAHAFELPALRRRLGPQATKDLLALARRNHALLRERFGHAAEHVGSGSAMLSMRGDEQEAACLREAAELLREDGAQIELGVPHPALRGFGVQLSVREDGQLHPGRLSAAMAAQVPRARRGRVASIDPGGEAALEGGGRVRFERALIATNAHVGELVPALRGRVTPQRAQMLATEPLPRRVIEPVMYANWGHDYFRQRADGAVLLGGRRHLFEADEATDRCEPSEAVQRALDDYLAAHLPFAAGARVRQRWAGIMGFSPDELPLMGPAPGLGERVHVLAGFTGHGLGLATVLAELWADRVSGGASPEAVRQAAIFDPLR